MRARGSGAAGGVHLPQRLLPQLGSRSAIQRQQRPRGEDPPPPHHPTARQAGGVTQLHASIRIFGCGGAAWRGPRARPKAHGGVGSRTPTPGSARSHARTSTPREPGARHRDRHHRLGTSRSVVLRALAAHVPAAALRDAHGGWPREAGSRPKSAPGVPITCFDLRLGNATGWRSPNGARNPRIGKGN